MIHRSGAGVSASGFRALQSRPAMPRQRGLRREPQRRRQQRGVVLFVALILLLILTLLGVSVARMQTVQERLAQNADNHQIALQAAEAALQAAYDDDGGGQFIDFSGSTPGLKTLAAEIANPPYTTIGYNTDWGGGDTIAYNGAALSALPAAAAPQFVVELMAPAIPPGCNSGNAGNYPTNGLAIHRITAHAAGADGTAGATVQTIRIQGC